MKKPSVPSYVSSRMTGVELEIDVGHEGSFNEPSVPNGWTVTYDGSLRNGREFISDAAVLEQSVIHVEQLCSRLVDMNTMKSGGLHVHVQVADYSHADAVHLAKLYSHFQPVINKLVGKSRVNNSYCSAIAHPSSVVETFGLRSTVGTRAMARNLRKRTVINFAMMRCVNPIHRTVEFRQGSVSKKAICVNGWMIFCVALVDMAKANVNIPAGPPTLAKLLRLICRACVVQDETRSLAKWVQWRYKYMNGKPKPQDVKKLVSVVGGSSVGLFAVSRLMDTNLALAERILNDAVHQGMLRKHPSKKLWKAVYDSIADHGPA
jgi:hypothetical protein